MLLQFYYKYKIWFSFESLGLLIRLDLNVPMWGNYAQFLKPNKTQ